MTTSTIDPSQPPANTPVASGVVRQQFGHAINDINALWAALEAIIPIVGVSSFNGRGGAVSLLDSDVNSALGFDPSLKMGNFHWISPVNTGAVPISIIPYSEYAFTIVRLNNLAVSAGSTTLTIAINGTPVTGLSGLAVTTSPQNPVASALNSIAVGDEVTVALSGTVGANNLKFSMLGQL